MTTQSKTTIILISIFIIGFLLGIVVDRTFIEHQMKNRVTRMRNPRMIGHLLERVIQPTPEQRDKIEKVLKKYSDKLIEKRHIIMNESGALMDSLRAELEPILTDEQKRRMEEHRLRFKTRERGKGKFPGPMRPPIGEPPVEFFR